ncbi:hypothetical protein LPJ62_003416 [Coemansia sp. RSA 2167]|nr:hypothetical protein LPJ62_003416 [Coemansia sp. RSA 2167]KAJ2138889.1 hypothetical protein GGH17_000878 [Coemansia sp. RSA 788]KAJ2175841.1 hypothetical protein GGH16_000504 [Coemansia sp. RSA 560]KAJ2224443.1 hypothetical protein IW143_000548 [Coemansia sp. RSA 520]KAJ2293271.1 hypothetical protein IW141_001333 [Coemansia sp. RSA 355]
MDPVEQRNLFLRVDLGCSLPQAHIELLRDAVDNTDEELTVFISLANVASIAQGTGWTQMQRRISELYAVAAGQALKKEWSLIVDVIPLDFCAYSPDDMEPYMHRPTGAISKVGGTFDHLHIGHKILLTATALAATKRVVCGISADALLEKKKYKELLEPYRVRELNTLLFLRKIRKDIIVELAPISDPYGPTSVDASIEALVVSQETLNGSKALNVRREENGLAPMHLMPIDLIVAPLDGAQANSMHASVDNSALKISSTAIRAALAEKQQRGSRPPH